MKFEKTRLDKFEPSNIVFTHIRSYTFMYLSNRSNIDADDFLFLFEIANTLTLWRSAMVS